MSAGTPHSVNDRLSGQTGSPSPFNSGRYATETNNARLSLAASGSPPRGRGVPFAVARGAEEHGQAERYRQRERQRVVWAGHHGNGIRLVDLCLGRAIDTAGR